LLQEKRTAIKTLVVVESLLEKTCFYQRRKCFLKPCLCSNTTVKNVAFTLGSRSLFSLNH